LLTILKGQVNVLSVIGDSDQTIKLSNLLFSYIMATTSYISM